MIWRIIGVAGLAAAAMACSAPAFARQPPSPALWSAYGGNGDDGRPLCGITTAGAEGRRIAIEQSAGETAIELRLQKDSWAIPDGTQVELRIQFDTNEPVALLATGSSRHLTASLAFDQSVPVMRGIRAGRIVRVFFPSGSEPPWTGGLLGSGRALDGFNTCRVRLSAPPVTQPFPSPPSGDAPGPTQPFAPTPQSVPPRTAPSGLPPVPLLPEPFNRG